jgi:glucokinase
LLADIGATNARFCLETSPGKFTDIQVLPCAAHQDIRSAIETYLMQAGMKSVNHAAIAIANPVVGDRVRMTNHHWEFSVQALRGELGLRTCIVVNDFAALARAIPYLGSKDTIQVGGGQAVPGAPIGLLGAGTGLGVSSLVQVDDHHIALAGEGGHVSFAPANEREVAILRFAWKQHDHVSAERLMAGPGLALVHQALADYRGIDAPLLTPAQIVERAVAGSDPLCVEVIQCFCEMLGTFSANLAVTLGAKGGIYIGGGVVPRLGALFTNSAFRARFEAKGRMRAFVEPIPVHVIIASYPAFLGVSSMLEDALEVSA